MEVSGGRVCFTPSFRLKADCVYPTEWSRRLLVLVDDGKNSALTPIETFCRESASARVLSALALYLYRYSRRLYLRAVRINSLASFFIRQFWPFYFHRLFECFPPLFKLLAIFSYWSALSFILEPRRLFSWTVFGHGVRERQN